MDMYVYIKHLNNPHFSTDGHKRTKYPKIVDIGLTRAILKCTKAGGDSAPLTNRTSTNTRTLKHGQLQDHYRKRSHAIVSIDNVIGWYFTDHNMEFQDQNQ